MTEGSISRKIIFFAIPLFIGNLFQQLYNTADSLIVGNFLGSNALAAVSSSGNLIFLMVGFINGIALGAGVVIARYYGAKNKEYLQKAIHTTVAFGLAAGLALTAIGMFLAPKILVLMGTPSEVLPQSIEYFRTYFAGSLGFVMYNIFVGILQSVGDSRHPLIYLIVSSCINVVLDIFFIAGLGMGVGAAALATAISQFASAIFCMIHLMRTKEEYRLQISKIGFDGLMMKQIIQNGVPSGFQMLQHSAEARALEVTAGITVIGKLLYQNDAVLFAVFPHNGTLVGNAGRFAILPFLIGKAVIGVCKLNVVPHVSSFPEPLIYGSIIPYPGPVRQNLRPASR